MRICHFISSLEAGGAQSLIAECINEDQSKTTYTICHFSNDTAFSNKFKENDIPVHKLGEPSYSSTHIIVANLIKHLEAKNIDILHTHLIQATPIGRLAGTFAGISGIISTIHNVQSQFSQFQLAAERATRPLDSATVAVSVGVAESFGRQDNWIVIPNGIQVRQFNQRVSAADASDIPVRNDHGPIFLCIGRLVPQKNHPTVIRAMSYVIDRYENAKLLIVGSGPESSRLSSLIKTLGLTNVVKLQGHVPDVEPYYNAADCFVLPSKQEGLAITCIEAMAAELPVVATDIPGNRSAIQEGETGYLIPVGRTKLFAEAMIGAVETERRKQFGQNGYKRAKNKYDIVRTKSEYLNLYEGIVHD